MMNLMGMEAGSKYPLGRTARPPRTLLWARLLALGGVHS